MPVSFRFIHASDFHLERLPRGLAEIPDHLRGAFIEAPYRAAQRVFDAALKERADFVVLAGDVIDPRTAGPRGIVFLEEQFGRLAQNSIQVYWAGGRSDDFEHWADLWKLPDNVVRFPLHRVERIVHERSGEPLAQILGVSSSHRRKIRAADFQPLDRGLFSAAVAYGSADGQTLGQTEISYWALGGEHDRRAVLSAPAHYPGSPQGRRPQEPAAHGCTLVQVDEASHLRTSFIPTDAIRFHDERLTVNESVTSEQLQQMLSERAGELLADPFGPDLLVQWTVVGGRSLASRWRDGKLAAESVARLRAEHGQKRPALWTLSVDPEATPMASLALLEEDTVLGEFLRTVNHYLEHPDDPISLEPYLAQRHRAGSLATSVALAEPPARERVLAEVARLGIQLLAPEETRS